MIFKKQISILITFLVLVSNSGLAFNIHFCEGKIASITSVFSKEEICDLPIEKEQECCMKKEPTHQKCCSDKEVNLKNNAEKVILKISFYANYVYAFHQFTPLEFNDSYPTKVEDNVAYSFNANAPPLYQLYCQYTFYA
ncbi:HYC_CC_PP family protein [Flavobacterium sp.]